MEQISSSAQHVPTCEDIMNIAYETQRILRESAAEFDRRMKEEKQARLKSQEEYEQLKKATCCHPQCAVERTICFGFFQICFPDVGDRQ